MRNRQGFSLIELLISMTIFTLVAVSFIVVFVAIVNVQTHQSSQVEVTQQSQFASQQIQYYVEGARLVDMPLDASQTTLTVRMANLALDPTVLSVSGGILYVQQGANPAQQITSNRVIISAPSFTRHFNIGSSTPFGTESVSFSYSMAANTSNTKQKYSANFQSAAPVLAPVPKIALMQQTGTWTVPGTTNVSVTYNDAIESGDLLIAVTGNTTSSASVGIADTAGNTWTTVASIKYPAFDEELTVSVATSSANSADDAVTATFGESVSNASLFVYEYRGATIVDATSSQLQGGTSTPSSGLVSPTSTAELLFGAGYNASETLPLAGSGFALEMSSTVSNVFTEDMVHYVTGAVDASWQYPSVTSSSALIVTFR